MYNIHHIAYIFLLGYLEFKREDSADIAVKKSGKLQCQGRPLTIDFDSGRIKGSYRPLTSTVTTTAGTGAGGGAGGGGKHHDKSKMKTSYVKFNKK